QMTLAVSCLLVASLAVLSSADSVTFLQPPSALSLKDGEAISVAFDKLNSALLGLSTGENLPVKQSLFAAPRAILTVEVNGVSQEIEVDGSKVPLKAHPVAHWDTTVQDAIDAQYDAADFEVVHVHGKHIRASDGAFKKIVEEEKIDSSKLKSKGAHSDALVNGLRLAKAIQEQSEKLNARSGPSVFRVQLSGAAAAADIQYVLQQLSSSVRSVYGVDSIVEFVQWEETHKRSKRDTASDKPIVNKRKSLNVYVFASSDYPAIFAIFAGLVIVLALAILYIAVGLWNLDPGKDSIIYRMTTTRQKKD
ncbi:hypothetical protein PFISCL1PPCAC_24136, partial [Pristionchus fissidentatus]